MAKEIPKDADDLSLIAQVKLGKPEAFEGIVRRHEQKIRGFCRYMLGDASAAEDAAQDVFVKAYQSLSSFHPSALFTTWLFRIARNHCIDLLRKHWRERTESLEALTDDDAGALGRLLCSSESLESRIESREILAQLLSNLPENYRDVIVLREMQGLRYEEIAEVTNNSLDGVKACLKRARARIQELMRHQLASQNVEGIRVRK